MSGHLFWPQGTKSAKKLLVAKPDNVGNLADGVIFYTDGSLCESRAGAGVFSDTLDRRKSYALGSLVTVFQTDAITTCSDYCQSTNMLNLTICICSDSKAALLALSFICNFV
jgi:hypothetical protein